MKRVNALFDRDKDCDHPSGFAYRGKVPCTGPRVCHLCGSVDLPSGHRTLLEQELEATLWAVNRILDAKH